MPQDERATHPAPDAPVQMRDFPKHNEESRVYSHTHRVGESMGAPSRPGGVRGKLHGSGPDRGVDRPAALRSRSGSVSSGSGASYSSYSYSVSEDEPMVNPRERVQYTRNGFSDFRVRNIDLAGVGLSAIELAACDMPGLFAVREKYAGKKPLEGARIAGCIHVTVQTAVLIETLVALGASVRWCSCNVYSTQDPAAAAIAHMGVPIFAWKGETEEDFWWCVDQTIQGPDGWTCNMLLDDGGDLTGRVQSQHPEIWNSLKGITEETVTGVHRLFQMTIKKQLSCPAVNVNDSVTKAKFNNLYGCRESIADSIRHATGAILAGKTVVVCGFGDVGKGVAGAMRGYRANVVVTEIDPICALQACMEGYTVRTMETMAPLGDVFITCTGNKDVITRNHIDQMKDSAIVCNMGHFNCEISADILSVFDPNADSDIRVQRVKPLVDYLILPNGRRIIMLAEGRLVNLALSSGHPSFVMSISFTNQVLAQIDLFTAPVGRFKNHLYLMPRKTDEEVARLHLKRLGAELTTVSSEQARYLAINPTGPFHSDWYRY